MNNRDIIYIKHMLESIDLIEQYTTNVSKEKFLSSPQLQDAVIRRLEIIGEAAKKVSVQTRRKHPAVPWKAMAGMRDVLIHEYFGVDMDLVWNTVKDDLPKAKKQLIEII